MAQGFIDYINSVSMPEINLNFSNNNISAYLTEDRTKQRTDSITVTGDSNYYLTIKLQDGVTLYNETKGTKTTGIVNIYGGDRFHLEAPLSIGSSWISDNITNCKYKFQSIIYRTENGTKQDLASGIEVITDSSTTTNLTVNWINTGYIEINKYDEEDKQVKLEGVVFGIYDESNNLIEMLTTDANGYCKSLALDISKKYVVKELSTIDGYEINENLWNIEIKENEEICILNIGNKPERKEGMVTVIKVDKNDEDIRLEGAIFGIYNKNEELVTTIITDENGEATSEKVALGEYYVKELDTGSPYYLLNEKIYNIEIKENDENLILQIENEGVNIDVSVEKKGNVEIKPGEEVNYTFSNITNLSNTYLENFKWIDYIPADFVRLEKMNTGKWNQDLYYDVYYKTNMDDRYTLYKNQLHTLEKYELDVTEIELKEDEYITEIYFDFGRVDIGFKEESVPTMECKSIETLEDGEMFTNHTKTIGTYFEMFDEANSEWTTIVHKPEPVHEEILPRTGE